MAQSDNWTSITDSSFAWEREALDFIRVNFPTHEPYRAWSNFEFVADDGSVNEVDLLVFTPHGFFLIEIKSRPGRLFGDAGTWTWQTKGRPLATVDNPLILANTKAKKLRSLLQRQKAVKKDRNAIPFIEAVVFLSAEDLHFELKGNATQRLCLRQRVSIGNSETVPDVMGVIKRRECSGLPEHPRGNHNKPTLKLVSQALQQAGIRQSNRSRKVSDYELEKLIDEGPGYQDWQARHTTLENVKRRVRIYNVRTGATEEERETIARAARREGELLETLQFPGILRREGFTEHELGPALIFEHDPRAIRLDHFLSQRSDKLNFEQRCDLMRQIAETVRFAHQKHVVHRSLSPRSILVSASTTRITTKIFNWQAGYRDSDSTESSVSRKVTATSHVERLVESSSAAYMAPEAISDKGYGEHLDVFSLGAIAYHIFSGSPPATTSLELNNKLRESKSLQISSVVNGVGASLEELVSWSTLADLSQRIELVSTVDDFLGLLAQVEEEASTPDPDQFVSDPNDAKKGDILLGELIVLERLGKGANSIGLLVEESSGEHFVLKVAIDPEFNQRLKDEAAVLRKLRHAHIVEICEDVSIGEHFGFLMRPVMVRVSSKDNSEHRIETLGKRLRREGQLHVDLLQRFGEDLIDTVNFLEDQGIPHRDIKPDNIAIGHVGSGSRLHLVLFDFSLSRMSVDNIHAGTTGYLDPLLSLRKPPKWDLHAERYAVAATLYEMAAGPGLPKWGDGAPPDLVDYEVTIDGDRFDSELRDPLVKFFTRAFRRDITQRFDNAEEMLDEWRACFSEIEAPADHADKKNEATIENLILDAEFDTLIQELGLGTRLTNALDRANILTVEDLLTVPSRQLMKQRGVGNKTRREILQAQKLLRKKLGPRTVGKVTTDTDEGINSESDDVDRISVDRLVTKLMKIGNQEGDASKQTQMAILGLNPEVTAFWPTQAQIAETVGVTRGRIAQIVGKNQTRWAKEPAITKLRTESLEILEKAGGVMSVQELAEAILVARGSVQDEPERTRLALAVSRACLEVERSMSTPRFFVRRERERILVATSQELANYAAKLGQEADQLSAEDPLVPPARVIMRLRSIKVPMGVESLSDNRMVRLAAAVSTNAALSSRQELYPVGMAAERALKLSQGALYGVPTLTVEQIRNRVKSRYPESAPLPDRPELDGLLKSAGFDFHWDSDRKAGGCFVSRLRDSITFTSASESLSRWSTRDSSGSGELTPEEADARKFSDRLERGIKDGSFLALLVGPRYYQRVANELARQFNVEIQDLEGIFLDALREVAEMAKVNWDLVLATDATPQQGDWDKLMLLIARVMPIVKERLFAVKDPMLIIYPNLLARYDQLDLLQELRDAVGRRDGLASVWVLVPGGSLALIDGKAVPLLSGGQQLKIPDSWIRNLHRSNGGPSRHKRQLENLEKH